LTCNEASESIKIAINNRKEKNQTTIINRFELAKSSGELNDSCQPEALALLIMTLFKGMSLQAAEGATKDELHQIAEMVVDGIFSPHVNEV
jgi:hypothetical protein